MVPPTWEGTAKIINYLHGRGGVHGVVAETSERPLWRILPWLGRRKVCSGEGGDQLLHDMLDGR